VDGRLPLVVPGPAAAAFGGTGRLADNGGVADRPRFDEHPVAAGLLALLGVALIVGLVTGVAAIVGTRVLGVGGTTTAEDTGGRATMYLPRPEKTQNDNGPEITLAPGAESSRRGNEPTQGETEKEKQPKQAISLSVSQTSVAPMQQIDLTGVYPGGEGAILKVQRQESGTWSDFYSVTATVSNQTFSTYVQTGLAGPHRFRVVDTSSGKASNVVRVTVG
jgi:hypothetical protein